MIRSGDIAAAHFCAGDNVSFTEMPNVNYMIPADGTTMYQENNCVLVSAPNEDTAKAFMEVYLKPGIAALNVA